MNSIISSLRTSARNFLGLPTGITPTASSGEQPKVHLVTAPAAPVRTAAELVAASGTLERRNPDWVKKFTVKDYVDMRLAEATGKTLMPVASVRPPLRSGPARLVKPRATSLTPNVDSDDVPVPTPKPDSLSDVFKTLEDALKQLKKLLPADDTTGADDVDAAKAALSAGLKTKALACLNRGMEKVGARIQAAKFAALPPIEKMASAFNAQPGVAALSASLSPGRRASVALSPVGGGPVVKAVSPTPMLDDVAAIKKAIGDNEAEIQKTLAAGQPLNHALVNRSAFLKSKLTAAAKAHTLPTK